MKFVQPVMSPLDVVVMAKLAITNEPVTQLSLAAALSLSQSEKKVKSYLSDCSTKILENRSLREAIKTGYMDSPALKCQ